MRMLKPFSSNTRLITLCSRCHHSEFIHCDPTGGPCLFSTCKCRRFVPRPQPTDSPEADGELSSELTGTRSLIDEQGVPDGLVRFFGDWVRRIDQKVE